MSSFCYFLFSAGLRIPTCPVRCRNAALVRILGDDVKTGGNLVINPGTIVHKGAWLFRPGGWGPGIITKGAARLDRGHI